MGTIRSHEDETMERRFVISFAAMTILNLLLKLMHKPPEETANKGEAKELKPLDTCISPMHLRTVSYTYNPR